MIVKNSEIEEIASKIDVGLCDACGAIRMSDEELNEGQLENVKRNEVTAVLISTVRRDIGNLASEVRRGFSTLEERNREIEGRIMRLELKDASDTGKVDGIKATMAALATLCALLGGLVGWLVSFVTRK
jgi:hypothetical protein